MNLRQKLLTTFGGLAFLTVLTAGFTLWSIERWRSSEASIRNHYQRSLLLLQIRETTFRAAKEASDALIGSDADARQEFEAALQPVEGDFQQWVSLAETEEERQQVQQVRAAYAAIVQDASQVFSLLAAGQSQAAFKLLEEQIEARSLVNFQRLTEEAVASDRQYRQVVQAQVQRIRQTTQLALAIAAFAAISLMLLLAAYLASDLFAPLKKLTMALMDVSRGDFNRRLNEDRKDELGEVQHAFNHMVEAIAQRQQFSDLSLFTEPSRAASWQELPSRLTLHRLIAQLRSQIVQLKSSDDRSDTQIPIEQLEQLVQAIARFTEFGFPLDLNLATTDIRALLYELLLRFQAEFKQRAISLEFQVAPEVHEAIVDALKLREVLAELVRNALCALPPEGGRLGIRASHADQTTLAIEIADDGKGLPGSLPDRMPIEENQPIRVGLPFVRAIVEQHGGQFYLESKPGQGTYAQVKLPLRRSN